MQQLGRSYTNRPTTLPIKVLQFGGGNFLRAFVDHMVQVLNETTDFNGGIAIIKPTEHGDYATLKVQDGLFTVVLDGIKEGKLIAERTLVDCVQDIINPYSEWESYIALAENADVRFVVSNTTEAGIKFNEEDRADDRPPKEFPAKLTAWLFHRYEFFNGDITKGCVLLPCELIENNGKVLQATILQYADHWALGEGFKTWILTSNYFCSTLVDRIVSGYPSERAKDLQQELGYEDALLVAGEYYHSWVIQAPGSVQGELPFSKTGLNVSFVEDLAPYREMKVKILNGAHTAMVPVAYLAGLRLVNDAIADPAVLQFVETLLLDEAAKTLNFPDAVTHQFVQEVLDRFRNPLLQHQLISIALNSTSKFTSRLLPTLKEYYKSQGVLPTRIVFGLSALILFYKGNYNGQAIPLKDDVETLQFFASTWKEFDDKRLSLKDCVALILGNRALWGEDLTQYGPMVDLVSKYTAAISQHGVKKALANLSVQKSKM